MVDRILRPGHFLLMLLSLLLVSVLTVGLVFAQGPTDNDVNRVANQLYCPVCENITLANCGTQACAQWRERIRTEMAQGKTDQQIIQGFVNDYGVRVLGDPPREGFTGLVWLIPPLAVLLGVLIYWRVMRGWLQHRTAAAGIAAASNGAPPTAVLPKVRDEYEARLEQLVREDR